MIDKQIIYNGVDVSGCEFYDKNKKYCLTLKMDTTGFKNPSCFSGDFQKCIQDSKVCPNTFCDNNPNCYYKQLKRKEQECQQTMDNYVQLDLQRVEEYNELVDLYKAKEQECEGLKNIINEAKNSKLDLKSFFVGEAVQNEYEQQLDELKQTLAEIKELAEKIDDSGGCIYGNYDCDNCFCTYKAKKLILQKISECEVK